MDDIRFDMADMAGRIVTLVRSRGVSLTVNVAQLARILRQYAEARQTFGPYEVRILPNSPLRTAGGWTAHDEEVWLSWLSDAVTDDVWQQHIIDPVFGTDIRVWETMGTGWRQELLTYLPMWVARSFAIVERYDPLPRPEEEAALEMAIAAEEADGGENGGRRRRR